jgi:hypothetical protein
MVTIIRDVEIVWDDLLTAFENSDDETVFFLDRESGEIFSVPADYEDEDFWREVENNGEHYLRIPIFGMEQERALLQRFVKGMGDDNLRSILEQRLRGKFPHGNLQEILSFYPDEEERLDAMREELTTTRIKKWLEEKEIHFSDTPSAEG